MKLSIVIPCHDDALEVNETIKSIRATTPSDVECIVVDDCSPNLLVLDDPKVRLIHNRWQTGAGAARHVGILAAHGDTVLLCDAHCRFEPGWYDQAMLRVSCRPKTLHCAVCLGFTDKHPPYGQPDGTYYGAEVDLKKFDGVWAKEREDDAELPCLMGACYFVPRAWYLQLGGLQFLRGWGLEEMMLSLKTWMAGGDIRLMKKVRIWHKFRTGPVPYKINTWHIIYNKLFLMHTMLPADVVPKLCQWHPSDYDFNLAQQTIKADWNLIVSERMKNEIMLKKNFYWICEKFGLVV